MKTAVVVFKKTGKPKEGRGFSRKELEEAALDSKKAMKHGIPVDLKRRTLHEENVQTLKEYLKSVEKPRRKAKASD
jgi:ribosomal protein L13E